MNKIRLSYSLLSAWHWGRKEDVVNMYLRIWKEPNEAMKRGLDFDKMVTEFAYKNKKLPPELGSMELRNPIIKPKITVSYNEVFDLKTEIDIFDTDTIFEIKNSKVRDSGDFADDFQIPLYFLALDIQGYIDCKKAWIFRYDPTFKKYDSTLLWKSERRLDEARYILDSYGPQIKEFLIQEGII